jgi:hypothetical protein
MDPSPGAESAKRRWDWGMDAGSLRADARRMGRFWSPMGPYYTNAGPAQGPLLHRDVAGAIGVLEAPDKPMSIGMEPCLGWGPDRGAM